MRKRFLFLIKMSVEIPFFKNINAYFCIYIKNNERGYFNDMLIINVKDGESLDRALKRFKKKFEKTGVLRELRSRQAFEKKSITNRTQRKKAVYKQKLNQEVNN